MYACSVHATVAENTHTHTQVSTLIGYGSPNKADSHDVHGAPLGAEETVETRKNLKWDFGEFEVPQDVMGIFRQVCGSSV